MSADEVRARLKLAEDMLPGLLAEALAACDADLEEMKQVLGGHIRVAKGEGKATLVTLERAGTTRQNLCFQTLDVLEQIACALEDGPDSLAAVELPTRLLHCLSVYHGVIINEDRSDFERRARPDATEDAMDGDTSEDLVDDLLTESENEDMADSEIDSASAAGDEDEDEDEDNQGKLQSSGRLVRVTTSDSIFARISAALCHLLMHEPVQLSLMREPGLGLRMLLLLVEATSGAADVLHVLDALSAEVILEPVVEHMHESRVLARLVAFLRKRAADHAALRILSSVVKLLMASCRSGSQLLMDSFLESGGYIYFYEVLCQMPPCEETELLLSDLRQLAYLGPGFAQAEEEAEHLGVVHSVFLARNEAAFAVVAGLLCHIQYSICGSDARARDIIWQRHAFAWRFLSGSESQDTVDFIKQLAPVENADALRLPLLHCILTIYSSNPVNFGMLDEKFGVMSTLLISLGASLRIHDEFLFMVAKLLELISMGMDYRPVRLLETICRDTLPRLVANRHNTQHTVSEDQATLSFELGAQMDPSHAVSPSNSPSRLSLKSSKSKDDEERFAEVLHGGGGSGGTALTMLGGSQTGTGTGTGTRQQAAQAPESTTGSFVMQVLCKTLVKMVRSDEEYKDLLRAAGILSDALFPFLQEAARTDAASDPELFKMLPGWCTLLCDMLEGNLENDRALRDAKVDRALYALVPSDPPTVLGVLLLLARMGSEMVEQDIGALLEMLEGGDQDKALKVHILGTLADMMRKNHNAKDIVRQLSGFETMLAVADTLQGAFGEDLDPVEEDLSIVLLERIFQLLTVSMTGNHAVNRSYIKEDIRYESISSTCQKIGIFGSSRDVDLVDMVVDCCTEVVEIKHGKSPQAADAVDESALRIRNVDPLQVLTIRISLLSPAGLERLLTRLNTMVYGDHSEQAANCQILCETWIPRILMEEIFDSIICDPAHDLHDTSLNLLGSLARHHSTTRSIQQLLEMIFKLYQKRKQERETPKIVALLRMLNLAANPGNDDAFFCPYIQMAGPSDIFILANSPRDHDVGGDAALQDSARKIAPQTSHRSSVQNNAPGNLHIAGLGKRSWPPSQGYTMSFWIWLGEDVGREIVLASVRNTDGHQLLRVTVESNDTVHIRTCGPNPMQSSSLASSSATHQQHAFHGLGASSESNVAMGALAAVMASAEASAALSKAIGLGGRKSSSPAPTAASGNKPAPQTMEERFLRDLAPFEITFPNLDLAPGRWHHLVFVHKQVANLGLMLDKSLNGRMTLFCDGVEVATSRFPYPTSSPHGGLKTSVFLGVDPIVSATRRPSDPVRFWRLGPMMMLDVPKDAVLARELYILGVNYTGTLTRSCATLRDARSFTTVLLEQLFSYELQRASSLDGSVVRHLEQIKLPSMCWKELLQKSNWILNQPGQVDLENVVYSFYAGRKATVEGFPSIDTKSLVAKNIREIDVPRTVLVNSSNATSSDSSVDGSNGHGQQPVLAVLGGGAFAVTPLPLCDTIRSVGGVTVVLRLLELTDDPEVIQRVLNLLRDILNGHEYNRFSFRRLNGHRILAWLLFGVAQRTKDIFTPPVFEAMLHLAILGQGTSAVIVDPEMLHQLVLNHQVWRGSEDTSGYHRWRFVIIILQWLSNLVDLGNVNAALNVDALHRLNIIDWVLEIMLTLAVDIPPEHGIVADVLAAALQFLHNLNKQKLVRRSLFEMFKHILVSLPFEEEDEARRPHSKSQGHEDADNQTDDEPFDSEASEMVSELLQRASNQAGDTHSEEADAAQNPLPPPPPPPPPPPGGDGPFLPPPLVIPAPISVSASVSSLPDVEIEDERGADENGDVDGAMASPASTRSGPPARIRRGRRRRKARRRTVTDMMINRNAVRQSLRRVRVTHISSKEALSDQGEAILKQVRCMLFQLLLDLISGDNATGSEENDAHRSQICTIYADILSVHWFTCLMDPAMDSDTFLLAARLLAEVFQASDDFMRHFILNGGCEMLGVVAARHAESESAVFLLLLMVIGLPVHRLDSPIRFLKRDSEAELPNSVQVDAVGGGRRSSGLTADGRISGFVSDSVKKDLLKRREIIEGSMTVEMLRSGLVEEFEAALALKTVLDPPMYFVDVLGTMVELLKQPDRDSLVGDVMQALLLSLYELPELGRIFGSFRALEALTDLVFHYAALPQAGIDLVEQESGHAALDGRDEHIFTAKVPQDVLRFFRELICQSLAENIASRKGADGAGIPATKRSGSFGSAAAAISADNPSTGAAFGSASAGMQSRPRTMSGLAKGSVLESYKAKDGRKLLESMMQAFPSTAEPAKALWYQTALVQALLPDLSLMLDDKTWEARKNTDSRMKLPHNADPGKLVSMNCFLAGRASFGWVPYSEHTVLELTLQTLRCVDTAEPMRDRVLRCARGLTLWSLDVSLLNQTQGDMVQFLSAVKRNFNALEIDNTIARARHGAGNSASPNVYRQPPGLVEMLPVGVQHHLNLHDESVLFVASLLYLLLKVVAVSNDDDAESHDEVSSAALEIVKLALMTKRDVFVRDEDGVGPLVRLIARGVSPNLDQLVDPPKWLGHVWKHVQTIELFGTQRQCGLSAPDGLMNFMAKFDPSKTPATYPAKCRYLLMEVDAIIMQRRLREEGPRAAPKVVFSTLLAESKGLVKSTQTDAVERHRRWQRVGLEHLLRGKGFWKKESDDFRCGIYKEFFVDLPPDAESVEEDPLRSLEHHCLDLSEGKDRMRRRIHTHIDFYRTYKFAGMLDLDVAEPSSPVSTPVLDELSAGLPRAPSSAAPDDDGETPSPASLGSSTKCEDSPDLLQDEMNKVLLHMRHHPKSGEGQPSTRIRSLTDDGEENDDEDETEGRDALSPSKAGDASGSSDPRLTEDTVEKEAGAGAEDTPVPVCNLEEMSAACNLEEMSAALDQERTESFDLASAVEPPKKRGIERTSSMKIRSAARSQRGQRGDLVSKEEEPIDTIDEDGEPRSPPSTPPPVPANADAASASSFNLKDDHGSKQLATAAEDEDFLEGEGDKTGGDEVTTRSAELEEEQQEPQAQHLSVSLEDEMVALGWENAERILTELDQVDRKPERIMNCSDISGLEATKGVCLLCETAFYFVTNYQIRDDTGAVEEVSEENHNLHTFDFTVVDSYLHILPKRSDGMTPRSVGAGTPRSMSVSSRAEIAPPPHELRKLRFDNIREVYRRRFMFAEVGLELFGVDGMNVLLVFGSAADRDWMFTKILSRELPNLLLSKTANMQGLAQSSLTNPDGLSLGALMAPWRRFRASVTKRWQDGEISNFGYLMYLNTLAGRSHNDLTQYPVFPWVLRQFTEPTIDLEDPSSYRDLSKPMGALNPERAKQFVERYQSLESVATETQMQPFHYGTHYSCSAYVLQFLIRLEPYTGMALELQSGQFDRPDRLFHSFAASWRSVSGEDYNAQDVRELTPEFFYLPEFLENMNRFDFGVTQRGVRVDDVELPAWAENDARYFVRMHRRALESRFVSENLHSWIDLIFGFKQRGRAAIEAQNVFHPLTYEGEVNPDDIEDPLVKKATRAQIHNFGQTPRKLFSKPHPPRVVPRVDPNASVQELDAAAVHWHAKLAPPLVIPGSFARPEVVCPGKPTPTRRPGEVAMVQMGSLQVKYAGTPGHVSELNLSAEGKVFAATGTCSIVHPGSSHFVSWGAENGSLRLHSVSQSNINFAAPASKVVAVFEALHNGVITACSVTKDGKYIWTGGADALVAVWQLRRTKNRAVLWSLDQVQSLASHTARVTALATCLEQGVAVSGSKDCTCVLWDLEKKRFIRRLGKPSASGPIHQVSINQGNGNILALSGTELCYYHINGSLLASLHLTPNMHGMRLDQPRSCLATASDDHQDGVVAVTGHSNGAVALWDLPERPGKRAFSLRVVLHTGQNAAVTALAVDAGQRRLAVGDELGTASAWASIDSQIHPS
ncbi:BEACH domain-containing protein lvsA (Large volume sphere mutant protein A) [Durusdinium trenchii]|uniref:BEACH domain-containing protein lvsA (Large volume sphere mutant protein A) n=1 Tax=Durusdinium trenchii TaxID=1381693 RepID=A0ABP0S628_9DINO